MKKLNYIGPEQPDTRFHDGGLRPVMGACHIQVMRANKERPDLSQGTDYTYNHAPMLCRWHGRMYLMYLSSPVHEHDRLANAMLMHSADGIHWSEPSLIFPSLPVPPGIYCGKQADQLPPEAHTIVHHRMGFYRAPNDVLLVMTHHGVTPDIHVIPNSGYGMGRVVRRIHEDGTLGEIFVLRVNTQAGWRKEHFPYRWFDDSEDDAFVSACHALLSDHLANGAWWEEERLDEGFFPLKGMRAPSFRHLPDGRVAAIGKSGLSAVSDDEGAHWTHVEKAKGIISSGGKCWMDQTGDGKYAIVYNPSPDGQHRWPLAVIVSEDGYTYDHMYCAGGEAAPMRYGGYLKNFGLNYIRGMMEGNDDAPDGFTWLTYSMNKEDIWVLRLPRTLIAEEHGAVHDDFSAMAGLFLEKWYTYSPLWAKVTLANGCLELHDSEPYDSAKAIRAFCPSESILLEISLMVDGYENGCLQIDATDCHGQVAARVELSRDGNIYVRGGNGRWPVASYSDRAPLTLRIDMDTLDQSYALAVNGTPTKRQPFMCPVPKPERLVLRTGEVCLSPTPEDDLKNVCLPDLSGAGNPVPEVVYRISRVTVASSSDSSK